MKYLRENSNVKYLYLNCDELDVREILYSSNSSQIKSVFKDSKIILMDEVQRVKDIWITIKIIVDVLPEYQVIATSFSSIGLTEQLNEPLNGRRYDFILFLISWKEYVDHVGYLEANSNLERK